MSLGAKIRRLIELKTKPDGTEYSIREIAREASRLYREQQISLKSEELTQAGASRQETALAVERVREQADVLTRQYLSEMKDGKRPNPPWDKIVALSLFFGVETDYFAVGAAATEKTESAENEVELFALAQQLVNHLDTDSDGEGFELVGALMRGGVKTDPRQLTGMLRMQLAAMNQAQDDQTE